MHSIDFNNQHNKIATRVVSVTSNHFLSKEGFKNVSFQKAGHLTFNHSIPLISHHESFIYEYSLTAFESTSL